MAANTETIQDTSTDDHQARLVLRGLARDDGATDTIVVDTDTLNNEELLSAIIELLKVEAIDPVELNQVDEEYQTKEQERIRMTEDAMKSVATGDLPWVRDFVEAMRFGNLACGGVFMEAARFGDMLWVGKFVEAAMHGDLENVERIWFSGKIKHIDARDKDKWTALEGAITKSRRAVVRFLLSKGASVDCRMSNGTTALQIAAHYQDLTIVKYLVDANADLEAKSEKYELTALHFAAEIDSEEIAAFLIRRGASIDAKTADGSTPLHTAAAHGSSTVAALLIQLGATVDSKATDGRTPLHTAAAYDTSEVASLLVNMGATVDFEDSDGSSPVVVAEYGFLKIVKGLLQAGAQPSMKDRWGQSPLMMACAEGHLEIVKALLEDNTLDLDIRDEDKRTPLMWAADKGHLEIVKYLIEKRAEVNAEDINMNTPLALATYSRHVEVFKYLISSGASLECKTSEGLTLFDIAVDRDCLEIAEYLVDVTHVDPDKPFANGATPLEYAVNKGYHKMIAFLLQRCGLHQKLWYAAYTGDVKEVKSLIRDGVDVLGRHFLGWSVLYTVCSLGHVDAAYEIVKTLKDLGKKDLVQQLLELPDLYGSTPLFVAVFSGKLDLVKLLVSEGASVNAENNAGDMALTVAIHHNEYEIVDYLIKNGADIRRNPKTLLGAAIEGHDRIVGLLLQAGAETESTVASKRSPLMVACKNGHLQVVKSLVKRGVNLEAQDNNGFTALMYAAQQGHFRVVRLLVENRVNVNTKNHLGQTPLHLAAENKFLDVSLLLIACEASIKCVTYDGYTPLHSFAARDQIEMVKLAVKLGADVNADGIDGFSPSYGAASSGHFEVVDYLADHGAHQEVSSQRVWTFQSLRETYGRADFNPEPDPKWYIDRSKIECPHLDEADFEGVLEGKWLESAVTIVKPCVTEKSHVRQFVTSLETWNPLNHPHVLKLLGACHQNQHFFVAEQAKNGNLRSYLKTHPKEIWKILHEAALALQYMHERRIVHGGVQGSTILIGNDGSAKLIALGPLEKSLIPSESLPWQAPEAVLECRVSMESDVYSLGMCIIEAITGDDPYSYEVNRQNKDLRQLKMDKTLPRKPTRLSDAGWELVICMTREQPAARLKMADVVRELEMFKKGKRGAATTDAGTVCEFSGDADENIAKSLRKAQSLCTMTADSSLECQLITRWEALWNHLSEEFANETQDQRDSYPTNLYGIANLPSLYPEIYATCIPQQLLLQKFRDLANRLIRYLEVQKPPITHRLALERQREEVMYSLHSATDWLVKLAQLHSSPSEARGEWKYQWRFERKKRQQELSDELEQLQSLDGIDSPDRIEYLTYLMFELTAHPDSYALIDHRIVRDALPQMKANPLVQVQQWFIPHYDIEPEEMSNENKAHSGSFGSVLRGKWMDTTVVVKTLIDKSVQNTDAFKNEVSVWFGLYHPHVIKLFGACNVGDEKIFVCEYATGGELRKYLKEHRDDLWQKLYEAALGLHYLHENRIIHGDLKGDNILIGSDGYAKIADFGLSSGTVIPANDDVRDGIIILGAPRWRAPEALRGDEVTLKADVYAFAMCIVEMYTGEPPWMEELSDESVYYQTAQDEARMRPRKIPQKEWNVIKGMCRLSPAERPDMREVVKILDTLRTTCKKEPLEEPSSTPSEREELIAQSSNQNTNDAFMSSSSTSSNWNG